MLWFVSAAWRRFDVTRVALAQRAHLCGELAEQGIEANCVIVADDDNLDIASGFGFETVERDNNSLGRKFNDGLEYACRFGDADHVVLIGSDDWMHPDLFARLPKPVADLPELSAETPFVVGRRSAEIITGRQITIVDLQQGRSQLLNAQGRYGVIPWIIHRKALEPSRFRPINETLQKGIDGSLIAGLGIRPSWVFTDPHPYCRVDFKSDLNLTGYQQLRRTPGLAAGGEDLDPWSALAAFYPADLVGTARETHELLSERVAA